MADSSENCPPATTMHATTECRSPEQPDDIVEDNIMMKVKKRQSGSIIKDHVMDVKELDASVAQRAYMHVTGMSCASCVNSIETNMIKKPGNTSSSHV